MVISRETDYAMRILRRISDGEMHSIGKLCDTEHIPRQAGDKIIEKLQLQKVLIRSSGKDGGCRLCADLNKITLFDVMHAIGNECCVNLCIVPGHVCLWQETHMDTSKIHTKLASIQEEINERLQLMDLQTLLFD
ncbi:MAG: Rrf2 family transcriptional regulator [Eubacteriales bacterium]|nr:Rrf2 family transcriptional regulator [Eubacteriales bacterium]